MLSVSLCVTSLIVFIGASCVWWEVYGVCLTSFIACNFSYMPVKPITRPISQWYCFDRPMFSSYRAIYILDTGLTVTLSILLRQQKWFQMKPPQNKLPCVREWINVSMTHFYKTIKRVDTCFVPLVELNYDSNNSKQFIIHIYKKTFIYILTCITVLGNNLFWYSTLDIRLTINNFVTTYQLTIIRAWSANTLFWWSHTIF